MFQASKPWNQAFLKTHMVCPINPEKWFDASENGLMVISTLRKLVNFHRNIFQSLLLKRMEKQVVYHIHSSTLQFAKAGANPGCVKRKPFSRIDRTNHVLLLKGVVRWFWRLRNNRLLKNWDFCILNFIFDKEISHTIP